MLPLLRPDSAVPSGYQGYGFGFPRRGNSGIWAKGELSGHQYCGWRQIDDIGGMAIDAGFSGCPFLDAAQQRVIGMVVARHNRFPVSYLIPVETLFRAWGELARIARQAGLPEPASLTSGASTGANRTDPQRTLRELLLALPIWTREIETIAFFEEALEGNHPALLNTELSGTRFTVAGNLARNLLRFDLAKLRGGSHGVCGLLREARLRGYHHNMRVAALIDALEPGFHCSEDSL